MTTLNQGRNEIRFNNSGAKCLLENWVEERAVEEFDPSDLNAGVTSGAQQFKDGHKGLLSTEINASVEKETTFRESYQYRQPLSSAKGAKARLMEQLIFEDVSQKVNEEFNPPPPEPDYKSVTHGDFNKDDFVPTKRT